MYVVIIAGSLPTLRPLVLKAISMYKNRSNGRNGYMKYQHQRKRNSHALRPYNTKKIHEPGGMPTGQWGSDQSILPPGITKTTDIAIDYNSKRRRTDERQVDWDSHGDNLMENTHAVGAIESV